jgi:hypothetical protein
MYTFLFGSLAPFGGEEKTAAISVTRKPCPLTPMVGSIS